MKNFEGFIFVRENLFISLDSKSLILDLAENISRESTNNKHAIIVYFPRSFCVNYFPPGLLYCDRYEAAECEANGIRTTHLTLNIFDSHLASNLRICMRKQFLYRMTILRSVLDV